MFESFIRVVMGEKEATSKVVDMVAKAAAGIRGGLVLRVIRCNNSSKVAQTVWQATSA